MPGPHSANPRNKAPRPLDPARLEELALAYVARFSVSAAKLEQYLRRKLRERGWDAEGEPEITRLVDRLVSLRYVDDEAFARSKAAGLLRRGYGPRRVSQALSAAGIEAELREKVRTGEAAERAAALAMARKRRLGPFGAEPPDRQQREKQIAALLRAGHALASARELVEARSIEEAENWAEAIEEEFPE